MLYPYMTLADETEICHTQVMDGDKVEVQFERPNETGFDSARCTLPAYEWIKRQGFTDEEIGFFTELLHSNAHLIYRYAQTGGSDIAKSV